MPQMHRPPSSWSHKTVIGRDGRDPRQNNAPSAAILPSFHVLGQAEMPFVCFVASIFAIHFYSHFACLSQRACTPHQRQRAQTIFPL
jgi:hypothetical protein